MRSKFEPAIWSRDTGPRILRFDRCQLTITWFTSKNDAINQGCMSLLTYKLGCGRHLAWLRRRCRRRRAYAPTSNTASHDNHEKINSWVSFAFQYVYRAPLGGKRNSAIKVIMIEEGSHESFATLETSLVSAGNLQSFSLLQSSKCFEKSSLPRKKSFLLAHLVFTDDLEQCLWTDTLYQQTSAKSNLLFSISSHSSKIRHFPVLQLRFTRNKITTLRR